MFVSRPVSSSSHSLQQRSAKSSPTRLVQTRPDQSGPVQSSPGSVTVSPQAQLRLKPLESMTASRSLSSSFSRSRCSSRRATRASRCSTTSSISFRICFSCASSFSVFRWSEGGQTQSLFYQVDVGFQLPSSQWMRCSLKTGEPLEPTKGMTEEDQKNQFDLVLLLPGLTFHSHPLPKLLLQSTLPVLQLQLPSTGTGEPGPVSSLSSRPGDFQDF